MFLTRCVFADQGEDYDRCSNDKCQCKHSENGMRFFLHEPSFLCLLANYIFIPIIALCLYRFKWNQIKLRNRSCLNFFGRAVVSVVLPSHLSFFSLFCARRSCIETHFTPIIIAHLLFYFLMDRFKK